MNPLKILSFVLLLISTTYWGFSQCPRQTVIDNYNNKYLTASFTDAELNWTGDISTCDKGTMSETVRNKHLQKINYYRELVGGLTTNVRFDAVKNEKSLATVLMFEAANTPPPGPGEFINFSHCGGNNGAPCDAYACTSPDAIEAAQNANIAFVAPNWNLGGPIDNYMRDDGFGNEGVLHRRWILYSQAQEMGVATSTRFNTLWVIGGASPTATFDNFIAYPPNGFMPQPLVPARWSFGIPNADFSNATISMQDSNGDTVPLTITSQNNGSLLFGDNSIVWEPVGVRTNSDIDEVYTVTINNIAGAAQNSYTYETSIVPISYPPLCAEGFEWVENNCACEDQLATPPCPTTAVEIIAEPTYCNGGSITFFTNAQGANYTWDYGDGQTDSGLLGSNSAVHSYPEGGEYTVTAFVELPDGCLDTAQHSFTVFPQSTDFTYSVQGNTVTFVADSTSYTNNITNYRWEFEEGVRASGLTRTTTYTYSGPGEYFVRLETAGTCGPQFSFQTITIGAPPCPNVEIIADSTTCAIFPINFSTNVQDATYVWDYGDGQTDTGIGGNATHIYGEGGTYDVIAYATMPNGCIDTAYTTILVYPSTTGFSTSIDGNTVIFTADSTSMTNTVQDYRWTFEFGNTVSSGNNRNISYTFSNPGNYSVRLETFSPACPPHLVSQNVTIGTSPENTIATCTDGLDNDGNGLIDEEDPVCVCVLAPELSARFSYVLTPDSILFTDLSTGNITTRQWTFNTPEMIENNKTALPPTGSYEVCLIVDGCEESNTSCQTIVISEASCAEQPLNFELLENSTGPFCTHSPIRFGSTSKVASYTFYQGDGKFWESEEGMLDEEINIPHSIYENGGSYVAKLEVEYANGCRDSAFVEIDIYNTKAFFTYEVSADGRTYHFQADTVNFPPNPSYNWDIITSEDIVFGNGPSFSHTFANNGQVDVYLRTNNCRPDQYWEQITVTAAEAETSPALCSDGLDNDGDGLIDCEDSDCPCVECPTDVVIRNQSDADRFFNTYPGCHEISGNLLIESDGTPFTNVDSLLNIRKVGGSLSIIGNSMLNDLEGLQHIRTIGGDFIVNRNPMLSRLSELRIDSIGGDFVIGANENLQELTYTNSTRTLTTLGGSIRFFGNSQLSNLNYLGGLTSLNGDLALLSQNNLTSLQGLEALTTINGLIQISSNPNLNSLAALSNVTSINGVIEIANNGQLTSLTGLDNIDHESISSITLFGSSQLSFCSVQSICDYVASNKPIEIIGNAIGCEDVTAVATICGGNVTPDIFQEYPWLTAHVNPNNCNGDKITEYRSSANQLFFYIETATSSILYSETGQVWCTSSFTDRQNYDCLQFYRPAQILRTWNCGDAPPVDADNDNVLSDADPDDNDPCVPNNQAAACGNQPMAPHFLPDYPWLADLIDFDNCVTQTITIYQSGAYLYLFIKRSDNDLGVLYNQSGQFYCANSNNYDCVAAYNLTEITETWVCGDQPPAVDQDQDGVLSDIDPDDANPCIPDSTSVACEMIPTDGGGGNGDGGNSGEGNNTGVPPTFLNEYPWLSDLVGFEDCSNEKITVYSSNGYVYLFVETASTAILYSASGATYCTNSTNYECRDFYTVDEILDTWNCGDAAPSPVDVDNDGTLSDVDPDDNNPCVPDDSHADCETDTGGNGNTGGGSEPPTFLNEYPWLADLVDFETCTEEVITVYSSNGYIYLFVETANTAVLYSANGTTYCTNSSNYECRDFYTVDEVLDVWFCGDTAPEPDPVDMDRDGVFSDTDPDDMDPCNPDANSTACLITAGDVPPIFEDYPWLSEVISPFDCGNGQVTVYISSGYVYLFVETSTSSVLYNHTGVRYCANSTSYECRDFYTVDEVVSVWECGTSFTTDCQVDPSACIGKISEKLVIATTSIDNDFLLYPNPNVGLFSIELIEDMALPQTLTILTIQGQVLQTIQIATDQKIVPVNIGGQAAGVYLVQLTSERGSIVKRVVVK